MIRTFKRGGIRKRRSVRPTRKVSKGGLRVKGGRVTFPMEYFGGNNNPNLLSNSKIIVIKGGKRHRRPRRSSKRSKRR